MSKTYTNEQIDWIIENEPSYVWSDLAIEFKEKFGIKKTANAIRKCHDMYKDIDFKADDEVSVDVIKTAHRAKRGRSQANKELKAVLEEMEGRESFLDEFDKVLSKHPLRIHKPVKKRSKKKLKRTLFAHLSDTHFHAMIDDEEMGGLNKYTEVEEARRLAYFFREVADWKPHYRKDTELVLALNSDLLQGIIHDQESTPLMTTQFSAGLHLLTQGISYLAQHFSNVRVICTTGNHSRFMHKSNRGRQSKDKWDGFHTILNVSLKYALKEHKNVVFEIPATPYAYSEIQGHKYLILHGDTVLSPGNVGKSISTENLKNKINDLISGIGPIDVAIAGHVHVPSVTTLNNGTELITNGTMSGIDPFAQSIGIVKNHPSQQMFEITEGHAVGDIRFVRLAEADTMEELDKIITPFKGKF